MATTLGPNTTANKAPPSTTTLTDMQNPITTTEIDSGILHKDNGKVGSISADIGGPLIYSDNLPEPDSSSGLDDSVPKVGVNVNSESLNDNGPNITHTGPNDPKSNTKLPPTTHVNGKEYLNSSYNSTHADKTLTTASGTDITLTVLSNIPTDTTDNLLSQGNSEQYKTTFTKRENITVSATTPSIPLSTSETPSSSGSIHTATQHSAMSKTTLTTVFFSKATASSSVNTATITSNPPPTSSALASNASPTLSVTSPQSEYLPENCKGDKSVKLMAKSGFITSPGFENNKPYPPDVSCNWEIEDQEHEVIEY